MLPQTAFMQSPWLVVLVQTLGNHLRTMRTLGKDKSCLFFHNFSRPKHSLKATRIHEFFHTTNGLQRGFVTILPWGFSALQTSEALPSPLPPTSHEIHVWSGSTVLRGMESGAAPVGSLVGTCPLQNTWSSALHTGKASECPVLSKTTYIIQRLPRAASRKCQHTLHN